MLFERIESRGLAHYSYLVGCPAGGVAAVVDPRRDVDVYLEMAERHGVDIAHVLETHIHADFASGARELADRTGAALHASAHDAGETYEMSFPHVDLRHGEEVELGSVRIEALHTPGHTPEHLSFLVYNGARAPGVPELLLSGDFLFVGSLGRPDLLGEDAKRALAESMFDSVRERLAGLPDGLEVHPAHGAGSMCGSGMGGRASSTLGFERVANPYLDPGLSREEFVERLLGDVPPFPDYYRRMKRVNSEGPALLGGLPGDRAIEPADFRRLAEADYLVVDVRDQLSFGAAHIPDAFGIGAGPGLSTWAAWVVPYERPLLLVLPDPEEWEDAARRLVRVGLDDVSGWLAGGMAAWIEAGYPFRETRQLAPEELAARSRGNGDLQVLDVRTDAEWEEGHVPGATHIMGGHLPERLPELRADGRPLAVVCGSGYRSTVAASVLERAGFRDLINVTGGMEAWRRTGLPEETPGGRGRG